MSMILFLEIFVLSRRKKKQLRKNQFIFGYMQDPGQQGIRQRILKPGGLAKKESQILSATLVAHVALDSWPDTALKGFEPATFGSVFLSEATEGK